MMADSSSARNPIDTTLSRPGPTGFSRGTIFLPSAVSSPCIPSRRGTEKPQMSASRRPTTSPRWASATARLTVTDDLPTPPLPEDTARTRAVAGMSVDDGPVLLRLAPGPVHERAALGGVHLPHDDLDPAHAGEAPHPGFDIDLELGAQGAARRRSGRPRPRPARRGPRPRDRTMPRSTMLSPSSGSITPSNAARTVSSAGGEEGAGTPPILPFTWSATVRTSPVAWARGRFGRQARIKWGRSTGPRALVGRATGGHEPEEAAR